MSRLPARISRLPAWLMARPPRLEKALLTISRSPLACTLPRPLSMLADWMRTPASRL
ncbi:hypothetical protein D9M71_473320 [compost metagenome]